MHRSMWEIPVLPWKEAAACLVAEAVRGGHASHITSGGGGDGSDGGLLVHGEGVLPSLQQLFKEESVKGLRIKGEPKEVGSCETCLTSKFSRFPFHSAVGQSSELVELVHADLVGPMKVKGDGEALYSMTMVDDYTRLTWSFPLAKKSDAARVIIEEWLPMVERESGKRVKAIRSDRGGEFLGAEFRSWLKQHSIKQQLTTAYTPQSNGVAERANPTIIEGGRTILVDSGLPLRFWPLAIRHATVIKNRVLTHVGGQHWVPMEKWSGKKPLVDMLRVFGFMGLVHVSKEMRDNLQAAAVWAIHLGLARRSKGWLMWDPKSDTIFTTRDAKFMEGLMLMEPAVGSAQTLYDAVVACYSSPATAALSRLMLPYLFPDLATFPTVADLITHLRTSDTRYRAALPTEDHFLSVYPTTLSVDLLEQRLLAAETSIVAVAASRGDPRTPVFEGCSPSPLLPSVASAATADLGGFEALVGLAGAVEVVVVAVEGVGVVVGVVAGVEVSVAAVEAAVAVAEGAEAAEVAEAAVAATTQRSSSGGGQRQQQQRSRETPSPQVLREWYAGRQRGGGTDPPPTFSALATALIPRWGDLSRVGVAIFDFDYDAILAAMYGVSTSDEGDCYLCLPPDPGGEATALGACEATALGASASAAPGAGESTLSGTESAQVFHTFTLDSGASRSFFRDRTTLTPLSRPVAVSLADPSGGPVLASFSTVLPCPAAPSGTLSGLYLPSFSTNLMSGADLQDQRVDQFTPASQWVTHCTCARTGRHLATFTRRPGSSLYTLSTESPPVPASGQVSASIQVFAAASGSVPESAPCSCCLLSHQTLLRHHRLDHPSLPRLRGMASRVLVSGLPRSLPPLPPGPAPTCVPCVEGRQRAAPHSSKFPPTAAPLQTLHMDVWGPARVRGQGHERYFLLVVDDYSCYTTVFPLRSKGDVTEGIRQTFTLPASPQQNGIAERRIGMVMDVARTSMIHAAAPHFLWLFAVQCGDLKLSPRAVPCVFLGFPPDAPGWQFYHPTSRRVLSSQDVAFDESVLYYRLFPYRNAPLPPPPLFLAPGPPPVDPLPPQGPAPSGVSQVDAVEPVEVAVDSGAARGAEPVGAGCGGAESGGAEPGGAESGGAEPGGAEPGGAESWGAEPGGAEPGGAEPGGAEFARVASRSAAAAAVVGPAGASGAAGAGAAGGVGAGVGPAGGTAGAAGGTGAAGPAGVGAVGAGGAAGTGAATGGTGAVPVGIGGPARPRLYFVPLLEQVLGLPPSPGPAPPLECPQPPASRPASPVRTTRTSRHAPRPRPPAVPGTHPMTLRPSTAPLRVPLPSPPASSLPVLADPASDSLRAASPTVARLLSTVVTDPSFESTAASALVAELVDFAARCRLDYAASLVAESASVSPPSVGGECALSTDVLEDRQEEFQCFAAALPHLVSTLIAPEGDPDAPDIPTPRSYAEAIKGPCSSQWQSAMDAEMASWKSTGTYVDEVPPCGANIVSGMWIFRVKWPPSSPPVFKARYVTRGFSQRQGVDYFQTFSPTPKMTTLRVLLHVAAQRDYELHSLDFSTAFLQGSLHEEIWLRRPPGFTGSFPSGTQWSLRRPVYGLRQAPREWHDTLRTTLAALGFAPSTANPSLFLRTDTSLPPFYILVYVDDLVFATADTAGLAHVKSELQKRHRCTDLGELRSYLGLHITRDRAQRTITLTQSHMVQQVLQRFDFTYSSPQATPLSTRHSLSALPSDESVEPSGPILARYVAPGRHRPEHMAAAKRVLRYLCTTSGLGLVLGGRRPVVLTGHADTSWADDQATQRSSEGYTFSLGSGSVSWRSTRSSSAMLALCREHRLEHRTKHIALRYFLARELQQRGQLRLAYVASEANTADIFTKALPPGDHQRFCTMLACFALLDWSCDLLPTAVLVTVVGAVCDASVVETMETPLSDARRRHANGEYGETLPLEVVEKGICAKWATEHPSRPASPRPVNNEGGVDVGINASNQVGTSAGGTSRQRGVIRTADGEVGSVQVRGLQSSTAVLLATRRRWTWMQCVAGVGESRDYRRDCTDLRELQVHAGQGLGHNAAGRSARPSYVEGFHRAPAGDGRADVLHRQHRGDAASEQRRATCGVLHHEVAEFYGHLVVTGDLYIGQLEEQMTHLQMGEQETTTDYCNRARRLCVYMRMAGVEYSTASYITHVIKGLSSGYNLMKRLTVVPGTRESLNKDLLTSYFPRDVAMQKAKRTTERLPQANYVAPTKQGSQPGQRGMSGGGGSGGGRPAKDADKGRSAKDGGQRGGSRRRECWLCGDLDHLSFDCPDRSDSDDDDTKGGQGRSTGRRPCWEIKPRKEKQLTKSTLVKDADSSFGGKGRGDGEALCSWSASWSRPSHWRRRPTRTSRLWRQPSRQTRRWSCLIFYHPTSRRVLPSQNITFDKSNPFYRLFPYRSAPPPPPPLFLAPGPPPKDPLPPQSPAPSGVSQVDPLPGTAPVQVAVVSGAAPGTVSRGAVSGGAASGGVEQGGARSEGAGSGGAEPEGVEPGGAESEGAEPGGAESEGAESGGAEPRGASSSGGPAGASPRLSLQQLREWLLQRAHRRSGAPGAGEPGDTGARRAAATTGAGDPTEPGAAGVEGAGAGVAGVGGSGAGGAGAARAGAVDPEAGGAGGTVRPRPFFIPLLQQVLGVPSSTGLPPPFLCPPPDQSQLPLQPASPLPVPSPYTEQSGGLTERHEPASRPVSPVCTARRAPRSRPPLVPGTHTMALRPSSIPLRVPLLAPPESSLPEVPHPESDRARAANPNVARLLPTAVTHPSFESAVASALVTELLDFAAACHLDYASALVAESVLASPPSVGGECALGTDVLEDRHEDFECLAAAVPRFASLLLAPEGDPDAPDIPTPCSYAEAITGTYVDEVPPPGANIVDGMWIFRVKRPPGSPPAFKARYVARGFSQRQGVDYFQTFSPTPKMTTLWVLLHVAAQRDYDSSCEAEIYAGAMAAQELRWLTYLLTDLGELPRSPPVLYVDNKAMIALCQEHRLEHRTKHIALRYFLARELQQRGQLCLAYVATRANTADVFTKALPPACFALLLLLTGLVTIACSYYPPLRLWGISLDILLVPSQFTPCIILVTIQTLLSLHIDLCGLFRVAAKDGSLYFVLLKVRKTHYVSVRSVAKKSNVLQEFEKWMVVVERHTKKSVLMLCSDQGGEFMGKDFTNFVDGKWIALWVRNRVDRLTLPPGTTPHQLLTGKKPDLMLARVWDCIMQFLVPEQQRGGKPKPKARWGLHLRMSKESKGWKLLDLTENRVVTTSDVVFYKTMSLEVWKSEHGPTSRRTQVDQPTDTSTTTLLLLVEVSEIADEDAEDLHPLCPSPAPPAPPLVADLHELTTTPASGDEGSTVASWVLVYVDDLLATSSSRAAEGAVGGRLRAMRDLTGGEIPRSGHSA
ncbi:unnamed protein product [Closterium sp. NIES-53]